MKKPLINLHTLKKENVFQVPFQYFAQLPSEIQQKIASLNGCEIEQLNKENVFNVPFAYFKTLPLEIQQKLNREEVFAKTPKQSPFEVPANFFEKLTDKINEKIVYKTIENIEKANVFQTPVEYFEWLPAKIQARIGANQQQTTRLPKWVKDYQLAGYLALGVLSLWLAIGVFNQKTLDKPLEQQTQTAQNDEKIKQEGIRIDTLSSKEEVAENENRARIEAKPIEGLAKIENILLRKENNGKNTDSRRMIDFEIEQLEPQDILNYLSYTAISDNLLLEILLEEEQIMAEEAIFAFNGTFEEDIYEEINHEELKELNQLLKETKE